LLAIIIFFTGFIFLLLKYRKKFFQRNLLIQADTVWSHVADRATRLNLPKSDLIFGIWQDESATITKFIVKNYKNEVLGNAEIQMASRVIKISIGSETFEVSFPLTWNREAKLRAENSDAILASYLKMNIFDKHQFGIPGYGSLISERSIFSPRMVTDYRLDGLLIGTREEISSFQHVGRLAVIPSDLPLAIRIFILIV
jgi:hypothetical protein